MRLYYKLQCYQATHGSSMYGINLAADMLREGKLPKLGAMTNESEIFSRHQIKEAILEGEIPNEKEAAWEYMNKIAVEFGVKPPTQAS